MWRVFLSAMSPLSHTASAPVLALRGVSKHFGMTHALSEMTLDFFAGEVHAVVGENGAGKSTMIKIMTGIHAPSEGEVWIDGAAAIVNGPQEARRLGITAMYQEPMVFPDLDVAENIFISSTAEGWLHRPRDLHRRAEALLARIGMEVDVGEPANQLTLAEQQAVEIARALSQNVRVLIMDEPTAALSAHEAALLRAVARRLASEGVAVIYISHRLEEIFEIATRVTVIRDGRHISTRPIQETATETVIAEMVGPLRGRQLFAQPCGRQEQERTSSPNSRHSVPRDVLRGRQLSGAAHEKQDVSPPNLPVREAPQAHAGQGKEEAGGEPLLTIENLGREARFRGVGFSLRRGEILCMAGLIGARRTDVALAIFGIAPADQGRIWFDGRRFAPRSARAAMEAGIAYITEDRRKLGLALPRSLRENITLASLDSFLAPLGMIERAREIEAAEGLRGELNIRAPDVETQVGMLSGGNQQKTLLAKWLNRKPKLLIFDEPTRGIDVGAKAEVHELIRRFVAEGGAALVISSDLPEVLAMGDRILVMREGQVAGIVDKQDATQENIMTLAMGAMGAAGAKEAIASDTEKAQ